MVVGRRDPHAHRVAPCPGCSARKFDLVGLLFDHERLRLVARELGIRGRVDLGLRAGAGAVPDDVEHAAHSRMDVAEVVVASRLGVDVHQLVGEAQVAGRIVDANLRPEDFHVRAPSEITCRLTQERHAAGRWAKAAGEVDGATTVVASTRNRKIRGAKDEFVGTAAGGDVGQAAAIIVGERDRIGAPGPELGSCECDDVKRPWR